MYYLEYCLELNEELDEDCEYEYYVLHDSKLREVNFWVDDCVYYNNHPVVLKLYRL